MFSLQYSIPFHFHPANLHYFTSGRSVCVGLMMMLLANWGLGKKKKQNVRGCGNQEEMGEGKAEFIHFHSIGTKTQKEQKAHIRQADIPMQKQNVFSFLDCLFLKFYIILIS